MSSELIEVRDKGAPRLRTIGLTGHFVHKLQRQRNPDDVHIQNDSFSFTILILETRVNF